MSDDTDRRRVIIRLKHSLAEGEEIHAVLPDTLEQFDEAVARGEFAGLGDGLIAEARRLWEE